MNIKWYKNPWYWSSAITAAAIIAIAAYSQGSYSLGVITNEGTYKIFSLEFLYRSLFNPLWALSLWFYEKGIKLNTDRHSSILLNIQGLLVGADEQSIDAKKIYNIVYQYENTEKILDKKFKENDTINSATGAPVI